jgi:hypothetical protein
LYGYGAFTLNFPNALDKSLNILGSGIWLHGIPHGQLSRPPQDSEGCVVMQNELVTHLLGLIDTQTTPVILSKSLQWHTPRNTINQASAAVLKQFNLDNVEIYAYPAPTGTLLENESIYQVRFLLDPLSESKKQAVKNIQYWQYTPAKGLKLWLEQHG